MVSAEQQQQRAIIMEQMNPSRLTAGKFSNNAAPPLLRNVVGSYFRSTCLLLVFWLFALAELAFGHNTQSQSGAVAVASAASEAITLYRNLRTVGLDSSKIYKIRDAEFDLDRKSVV